MVAPWSHGRGQVSGLKTRSDGTTRVRSLPEPAPWRALDQPEDGWTGGRPTEPHHAASKPDTDLGRQSPCPNCGSHSVAAIFWGYAAPSVLDDPALGTDFILGGCVVGPAIPQLHCHACGYRW